MQLANFLDIFLCFLKESIAEEPEQLSGDSTLADSLPPISEPSPPQTTQTTQQEQGKVLATPSVRKIAKEHEVRYAHAH